MNAHLGVFLHNSLVGHLTRDSRGVTSFRLNDEYRRIWPRPVLGQVFEDNLHRVFQRSGNTLPAYFANLVPEGILRELIPSSLQLDLEDDFSFLEAVGSDLPGAIEVKPLPSVLPFPGIDRIDKEVSPHDLEETDSLSLRFSLAGVQLKFSVLSSGNRLTLPARGSRGDWIVKLETDRYPHVTENEHTMLEWARAVGFDVPECSVHALDVLPNALRRFARSGSQVLLIRRYDRIGDTRIHQEDFAQVTNQMPADKYSYVTYEKLGRLIFNIAGHEGYQDFAKRLAFAFAIGNGDAHLKNWSLIYPDGRAAKLSPLYDQVSTIAYPAVDSRLALKFAGSRDLLAVSDHSFKVLAEKSGASVAETIDLAHETIEQMARTGHSFVYSNQLPDEHREALRSHWSRSRLLVPHVGVLFRS